MSHRVEAKTTAGQVEPQRGKPQDLVLAFLGSVVLDRFDDRPVPTRVFLNLLGRLGVSDVAARATLSRMAQRGLLARRRVGRETAFTLTDRSREVLREGEDRILSHTPFDHAGDVWTLLAFSLPESRRDVRHRLRTRLSWAGFGPLRDGLWIAPGTVDVTALLRDLPEIADDEAVGAFSAVPRPPARVDAMIRKAWALPQLRAAHEEFLRRWEGTEPEPETLPQLARLLADWIRLLRTDPGLPAAHLAADWPAARSTAAFHGLHDRIESPAIAEFAALLDP
ncbi:PaaX family transcriptional regulator [Actinomadura craniellae]|uniref:PaaX family transcriptional regulator n=1 Tax=Actinomadura craniellae TaxID=2231787 RepID=UPI0013147E3A|nr:PaaX family transcriptional regulator C-terminal domain-containing protein [Actinomadura craniellae]